LVFVGRTERAACRALITLNNHERKRRASERENGKIAVVHRELLLTYSRGRLLDSITHSACVSAYILLPLAYYGFVLSEMRITLCAADHVRSLSFRLLFVSFRR
jgi:hypothetical protein